MITIKMNQKKVKIVAKWLRSNGVLYLPLPVTFVCMKMMSEDL